MLMERLQSLADPIKAAGKQKFGIKGELLGISMPSLRVMAKELGKGHSLAWQLWDRGINEAKILATLIYPKEDLTLEEMEAMALGFDSWDVVDQAAQLFAQRPELALVKIKEWKGSSEQFIKRASFSLMAVMAVHAKNLPDEKFEEFFPWILEAATDQRNFVKKAVNWALRQIGKRSLQLHPKALDLAQQLAQSQDKTAKWIGKNAVKELSDPAQIQRLEKKKK